jgi:hypothetical protein
VPDIRAGCVYLPLNPDGSKPKWVEGFIDELRQFPRAPHDDFVDMFTQGMDFLLPSVRSADKEADEAAGKAGAKILSAEERHRELITALMEQHGKKGMDLLKARLGQNTGNIIEFPGAPSVPASKLESFRDLMAMKPRRLC